jgi:hypothetical protein
VELSKLSLLTLDRCLRLVAAAWVMAHSQRRSAAAAAAACYPQAVYSPSKIDGGQVLQYENGLAAANAQMLSNFNTSLLSLQQASAAGAHTVGLWGLAYLEANATAATSALGCCARWSTLSLRGRRR